MLHRSFSILCISILLPCSLANASGYIFGPSFCDFSVEFPVQYKAKNMTLNGTQGTGATAHPNSSTSLGAECWPYEQQLPIDSYAQRLENEMRQRGISVSSVLIDTDSKVAQQVILSGRISASGKFLHIKTVSFIGPKSRLDLTILDQDIASQSQVAFRNSVKRR